MVNREDTCTRIAARIIALLESGVAPWRRPWHSVSGGTPTNALTGQPYRGVNLIALWSEQCFADYADSRWCTYKQAIALGGHVRKGERGTSLVLWKPVDRRVVAEDGEESKSRSLPMRSFTVFNVEQCEGLHLPTREPSSLAPDAGAEALVANYLAGGPALRHFGDRAYYEPGADRITVPQMTSFDDVAEYYSTLFHELGHSTGHISRLARDMTCMKGAHDYSREELVAEFTAAFLCALAGVDNPASIENSAAYLSGWASKLRDEPDVLLWAASRAQKAVDFIVGAPALAAAA